MLQASSSARGSRNANSLQRFSSNYPRTWFMILPAKMIPKSEANLVKATKDESGPGAIHVFGLKLTPVTLDDTLEQIDGLIAAGRPSYIITANLNYAMLSYGNERLTKINDNAALMLADGMPLVWAARIAGTPLPGRTTGADLVPALCRRAEQHGYRVFLLGGLPEAASAAKHALHQQLPQLNIVGIECPMLADLSNDETSRLIERVRDAKPDIILGAFGQPKGEIWIAEHHQALAAAVCLQIGAGMDFVAGRVQRAPRWMQRSGLEWLYRIYAEPRRLWKRYALNGLFLLRFTSQSLVVSLGKRWSKSIR
jgi:N-acetylglucosaminyldiphosphoundecaprenol N-acetyl-beta-D-mannosaminyltransferase